MGTQQQKLFRRLIDRLFDAAANQGKSLLMEDLATSLDYTREHFSRLYHMKYTITRKHINKLMLTFPELRELNRNIKYENTDRHRTPIDCI